MNKMQTLARIMLVGMGLFTAIKSLPQLMMSLSLFLFALTDSESTRTWGVSGLSIIPVIITLVSLGVVLYFLIYKSRDLALKIAPQAEPADDPVSEAWLPIAYRLVCVGAGLFFLFSFFWQVIGLLNNLSFFVQHGGRSPLSVPRLLGLGSSLAIGLYLITGARRFVQWHVRQTHKLQHSNPET
jgi:hypothetical protein